MPQNTPTIYLVGALILVTGALVGAVGQIVTARLQRGHEKRLKLDEVRRETYTALLTALREASFNYAEKDIESIPDMRPFKAAQSAEERGLDIHNRIADLRSSVMLVGGEDVQREVVNAHHLLVTQHALKSGDLDALVTACRAELGAEGRYVMG